MTTIQPKIREELDEARREINALRHEQRGFRSLIENLEAQLYESEESLKLFQVSHDDLVRQVQDHEFDQMCAEEVAEKRRQRIEVAAQRLLSGAFSQVRREVMTLLHAVEHGGMSDVVTITRRLHRMTRPSTVESTLVRKLEACEDKIDHFARKQYAAVARGAIGPTCREALSLVRHRLEVQDALMQIAPPELGVDVLSPEVERLKCQLFEVTHTLRSLIEELDHEERCFLHREERLFYLERDVAHVRLTLRTLRKYECIPPRDS